MLEGVTKALCIVIIDVAMFDYVDGFALSLSFSGWSCHMVCFSLSLSRAQSFSLPPSLSLC